jgi:DNA helicase-2/ATP-dependent DNA helicase PcrA
MEPKAKYDAQRVFKVLGKPYELTDQQARAIDDASRSQPTLVVAGAGSGKTELMAARVIWLIANEFAKPEEILGLTFTRKAAASLAKRVNEAIAELQRSDICPADLTEDFTPPTISTYNSYANNLFRESALQLGYESDAIQLTESQQFQLAREIVVKHGFEVDPTIGDLDMNIDSLVEGVLSISQSMSDNMKTAAEVIAYLDSVEERLASLEGNNGKLYADLKAVFENFAKTRTFARLAERLQAEKKARNLVDYSDQVALAERAAREIGEVSTQQQAQFRFVLLDEYQDTSYLQTKLLSGLFAGTGVFAVGDPNQAIYGWRGASSSNLHEFHSDFKSNTKQVFNLSISMRNPKNVLKVANYLVSPLGAQPSYLTTEQLEHLANLELKPLRALTTAKDGLVNVAVHQNVVEEARAVADWFKVRIQADIDKNVQPNDTFALLLRRRKNIQVFVDALQDLGLPVEVVGVSGLLEQPEIIDLVAALRSMHYPNAGTSLIRLLTGPRWRVGPKDIESLFRFARREARLIDDGGSEHEDETVGVEDNLSLIDAIDTLTFGHPGHNHRISKVGLARIQDAARLLAEMRKLVGLPLPELIRAVAQELLLDVELLAKPNLKNPLANLNAFYSVAANFVNGNPNPTLGEFLTWLEFAARKDERFDVPAGKPANGVIQILTVHAAKGLEWDYVVIGDMAGNGFPADSREGKAWLSTAQLPFELRGDRASLPTYFWDRFANAKEAKDAIPAFGEQLKERQKNEERRLIYVAATRPKRELLMTGSWSTSRGKAVEPSIYIEEALTLPETPVVGLDGKPVVVPEFDAALQIDKKAIIESWPQDPLGQTHGPRVRTAEKFVLDLERAEKPFRGLDNSLSRDIRLLIDESEARLERLSLVEMPVRIPASRFKDFVKDPSKIADDYLRPLPNEPFHATMSGTLFHAWVEQTFSVAGGLVDEVDSDTDWEGELAENSPLDIEDLKKTFNESRFASMTPVSVEQEIQVTIDQTTFICKIDAIFATENGVEIVDWKTGKAPTTEEEIEERALQLALYRMAYALHSGLAEDDVEVCLYYVSENREIKPTKVKSIEEIKQLWREVLAQAKQPN